LPLFIDPFLLFNSKKQEYRRLHDQIIKYVQFLRDKSEDEKPDSGLFKAWYRFPEIKQSWLGFSVSGNKGSGEAAWGRATLQLLCTAVSTNYSVTLARRRLPKEVILKNCARLKSLLAKTTSVISQPT
jgi:hypothetical protein